MTNNISVQEQANRRAAAIQSQNNRAKAFGDYLLKYEGFDEVARIRLGQAAHKDFIEKYTWSMRSEAIIKEP